MPHTLSDHARIRGGQLLQHQPGAVIAAVIGNNHFIADFQRRQRIVDSLHQRRQIALLVMTGTTMLNSGRFIGISLYKEITASHTRSTSSSDICP